MIGLQLTNSAKEGRYTPRSLQTRAFAKLSISRTYLCEVRVFFSQFCGQLYLRSIQYTRKGWYFCSVDISSLRNACVCVRSYQCGLTHNISTAYCSLPLAACLCPSLKNQFQEYALTVKVSATAYFTTVCSVCLLYTSPSPRDQRGSRMPSSA